MPEIQQADIVGNYLSSYYGAQKKQQDAQQFQMEQQRAQKQDERQDQQFGQQMDLGKLQLAKQRGEAVANIIGGVRDGDAQGFESAKQRAIQELGLPAEQVSRLTIQDLPRLRAESGQTMQELDLQLRRVQIESQKANTRQSDASAAASYANAADRSSGGSGSGKLTHDVEERLKIALERGLNPKSPDGRKFVLTGQMSTTTPEKGQIDETDKLIVSTQTGLILLNQALKLNPNAYGGFGMETFANVTAQINDKRGINTRDLVNLLHSQILPQLKAIFGGAVTDSERIMLEDVQGSASNTVEERRRILERSIAAAEARLLLYKTKRERLRTGDYFSPDVAQPQQGAPTAPPAAPAAPSAPVTGQPRPPPQLPDGFVLVGP